MYCKYGNPENVKSDVAELNLIIASQGTSLLIDVIAEAIGKNALKFKLNDTEIQRLKESLLAELSEAMNERT